MSELNIEEIKQIVKEIEFNPKQWNQSSWQDSTGKLIRLDHNNINLIELEVIDPANCGTTFCFAGHAIARAGYFYSQFFGVFDRDGTFVGYVYDVAGNLLGLDEFQKEAIFHCYTNDVDFLKHRIHHVTGIEFDGMDLSKGWSA